MIKNISIGKYIEGNSKMHQLDARTKIILWLVFTLLAFLTHSFISLSLILISCVFMMKLSDISALKFLKSNSLIIILSLFTTLLNLVFEAEAKLITSGKFYITSKTMKVSFIIFIKFISLILTTSAVMFTTSANEISYVVEKTFMPLSCIGINSRDIALTITITLRFIPTVLEEAKKIVNAQLSRGARFKNKNIFKTFKACLSVFIPLLVSSFSRAECLATALEARCYSGEAHTSFKEFKFKKKDFIALLLALLLILGVIGCNLWIKI